MSSTETGVMLVVSDGMEMLQQELTVEQIA